MIQDFETEFSYLNSRIHRWNGRFWTLNYLLFRVGRTGWSPWISDAFFTCDSCLIFFDLIRVYRIEKLKSKCFVWLKPTSFVVLPQWESTFGITELVNPSRSFLKKNWEDHKKNQNPNRAVCFKTSIKLSSGLHLNISLFQVSRIFKNFDRKTKHHLKMLPLTLIAGWSVRLSLIKLIDRSKLSG